MDTETKTTYVIERTRPGARSWLYWDEAISIEDARSRKAAHERRSQSEGFDYTFRISEFKTVTTRRTVG